jgi:hypothetical protein
MGAVKPRIYDLEEAKRVLPQVRTLVEHIVELGRRLPELQEDQRAASYRAGRAAAGDDDRASLERALAAVRTAEDDLTAAVAGLDELGVQLKDVRMGLIDFLSYRDGELVQLCWRLGEDTIAYWHTLHEGFAGRHRL